MKFINLHFLAFGCFTNVRLDFSEQGRSFHIIYGPNEAGKSTAMRALTGLLYGIPVKTPDAFLHEMKDLRVAAELERSDGRRGTFVRRKGNRDTLLDSEGKPLPDAQLLEFLGGVTEEIFAIMFRLDHDSLRSGGNDLLSGKGDLAESLFQAGTGITGLRQAFATLDGEAEQLFKPRSSIAIINHAIEEYENARKRSRDLAVPPKQWTEQSSVLEAKEAALKSLNTRLSELSFCKERLNRFRLALPHITNRKELMQELETLGAVILLPESATREREDALHSQRDAARCKEEAEGRLGTLLAELQQLQLPQELLAQAKAIAIVYERLDSYRQAMRDLPRVRAEQQQFEADARTILSEVKPELPLDKVDALRLTVMERTRLHTLAGQHHTLKERLRGAGERAESARAQWEEKKREIEQSQVPRDAGELERACERARKQGDLDAVLHGQSSGLRTAEEQAAADLQRLPLWNGTLEQLETLAVPVVETVERFETEFNGLSNEQNVLNTQREENRQRQTQAEEGIRTLQLGGTVPTEQNLQQARERREQGWQLVRRAWLERASDAEQEKTFDSERPLAEAYEKSVSDADGISDRLRREADRVARLVALLADKEGCESRAGELNTKHTQLTTRIEACQRRWHEAWQHAGIVPPSPKEMRGWLSQYATLLAQAKDLRTRRQSAMQLKGCIREHSEELARTLRAMGEPGKDESEPLVALLERSEALLQNLKNAVQQRANLEVEVKRLLAEHDKAKREHEKAQNELEAWQIEWREALMPLGLPADARAEEAIAVAEKLDALFKKLEDAQNRRLRVQEMEQHISRFDSDVGTLVQTVAADLRYLTPEQAAGRLHSLLAKAQEEAVRRQGLEKQIAQEQKVMEKAERDSKEARQQLEELMAKAHCSDLSAVEEAERKSARARQLQAQLNEVNHMLAGFTAGATLDSFLTDAAAMNADQLPFDIAELDREVQTLDAQRSQLEQEIGRQRERLQAMDGGDQATLAAEEAQSALATVRGGTERYLRLRLASEILRRYIERYRERNQDPVIKRASEIFPRLTLGSFKRIKTGFDDKDHPVLMGVRSSGEEVEVSGMSDGTRDQLFLALRLASLERQLASGEPLPFIADDILIKFDDDRAKATLEILAELCSKTQVLFFTHHARLAELALNAVPKALLKTHPL